MYITNENVYEQSQEQISTLVEICLWYDSLVISVDIKSVCRSC
jgi:hypothetical protein